MLEAQFGTTAPFQAMGRCLTGPNWFTYGHFVPPKESVPPRTSALRSSNKCVIRRESTLRKWHGLEPPL